MLGIGEFILGHWRAAACLVIVLVLASYIETLRLERDHAYNERDRISNEYEKFKNDTAALGKQAKADKLAKEAKDKKRKDSADVENSAALATLAGLLHDARSSPMSFPAACPADPSRADRFRAESERAYRDLVEGLRAEGERSSKAVIGLNTGKGWAQKP